MTISQLPVHSYFYNTNMDYELNVRNSGKLLIHLLLLTSGVFFKGRICLSFA